ncbi:hypothetical protein [Chryseobacterium indoltheticum]|uniref:hypothetical protein n=1 Tax=Chryseobacterium indoltheticum TaxID=254 RepID=UPI003F49ABE9
MVAINTVDELKLRIVDGQVILYDEVHVGGTIGRADGTFGFSFFTILKTLKLLTKDFKKKLNRCKVLQV